MIKDYLSGITSYFTAFQTISKLKLWKFFLVPILISFLVAGGIGLTIWSLSGSLIAWLLPWIPWAAVTGWVVTVLLGLIGLVLFRHLVVAAVSPFMTPLAQKIEEHMTGNYTKYSGFNASKAMQDFFRGITIAIRNIIKELFYIIPLFLLGLFPMFSIPCAILIFLIQAYYAGFGNMDYTLEGHFSVSESNKFVKKNRWLAIGNGTVFLLLLGTVVGFIFAPPLATVAAATESIKRLEPLPLMAEYDDDFV